MHRGTCSVVRGMRGRACHVMVVATYGGVAGTNYTAGRGEQGRGCFLCTRAAVFCSRASGKKNDEIERDCLTQTPPLPLTLTVT